MHKSLAHSDIVARCGTLVDGDGVPVEHGRKSILERLLLRR